MKSLAAAMLMALSLKALSFDPVYPTKNIRYISDRDYRTEVLDSDKYVVMVFSSDECLERTIIDRGCWQFERKLDYFVPKFSSKVKVIGLNTYFDNYSIVNVFHDFKKQGVPEAQLAHWQTQVSWETLLNKKGTTWRQLPPEVQATVVDAPSALALLVAQPSAIKRPVVVWPSAVTVGFDADRWAKLLP